MSDAFWDSLFGCLATILVVIANRWLGWMDNKDTRAKLDKMRADLTGQISTLRRENHTPREGGAP